jgi:hypothetical protein
MIDMECIISSFNTLNDGKYKKKLLWSHSYISKRDNLTCVLLTYELLDKLINKRSELKYLSNFRKINQMRFCD